jgi:hypothetical protein
MRESTLALVAVLLGLTVNGCGDGTGLPVDGVLADAAPAESTPLSSVDAALGIDTPPPQTDGSSSGDVDRGVAVDAPKSCNYPQCYASLVEDCVPRGPCVMASNPALGGRAMAVCYGNGVKGLVTTTLNINSRIMSTTDLWKNSSGICYSLEPSSPGTSSESYRMKDGAAAVLATVTINHATNTMTFTCNDEAPVEVSLDCADGPSSTTNGRLSQCTLGDCTF